MKLSLLLMTLSSAGLRTATACDKPSFSLSHPSCNRLWWAVRRQSSVRDLHTFSGLCFCSSSTLITVSAAVQIPFTSWHLDHTLEANVSLLCSSCSFFLQWLWKIETVWFLSSKFLHGFFLKINFYWSIVALQCCASFYCIAKWISFTYTYIPSFLAFLPIWVTTECWIGFPELYIRFLLKFSILYIEVYICQSQSPNSSHPPPSYWCLYVYSLHPHLYFCFC